MATTIVFIVLVATLMFVVFGFLGIGIFSRFKNAKKYINKKNSIIFCIVYGIALLFTDEAGRGIGGSIGYMILPYLGAILTMAIKTKFKKIFNDEFYFAFLGTLIFSIISTIYQIYK